MPDCARTPDRARRWLLPLVLALAGCSASTDTDRFELDRADAAWSNGSLDIRIEQRLALSDEARNALIHGVPLTIELELQLRNAVNTTRVGAETHRYEIRYLPLSNHYQLAVAGSVSTFPRLRHVLAQLSRLDLSLDTGALPAGEYELLARVRLDAEGMPPPMRLPVLLSAKWKHDSAWSSWPVRVQPEA